MNEITIYNKALKRVIKRETLNKMEKAKTDITYEEVTRRYREKLDETKTRILNGELDEEIKKEMELVRKELEQQEER